LIRRNNFIDVQRVRANGRTNQAHKERYDKKNKRLAKKKSEEYVDFIDAIEVMKKLTI